MCIRWCADYMTVTYKLTVLVVHILVYNKQFTNKKFIMKGNSYTYFTLLLFF